MVVGVGGDERVAIVAPMGEGRYMRDGARSYWVTGEPGTEGMMVIEVPICECISASLSPGIDLYSTS